MAVKNETPLQERIQKLIRKNGGYVIKTHGDMISEPGIPDLICCYRGIFIGIEVKIDNNTPSRQQGIQCRNIWKAGGIAAVVWTTKEVEDLLLFVDRWIEAGCNTTEVVTGVDTQILLMDMDNGRKW